MKTEVKPEAAPRRHSEPAPAKLPAPAEILKAFKLLFGGKHSGLTAKSKLRYITMKGGFILLEQNPNKTSQWARMARQGHQVAWLMPNYKGLVVDGVVKFLRT